MEAVDKLGNEREMSTRQGSVEILIRILRLGAKARAVQNPFASVQVPFEPTSQLWTLAACINHNPVLANLGLLSNPLHIGSPSSHPGHTGQA